MKTGLKSDSLAIIIPAYNEEKSLGRCLDEVVGVIRTLPIKTQVIVVNDGSNDLTAKTLQEKSKIYREVVGVTHKRNQGYGAALRTGINIAAKLKLAWCLFMDSDLTNNPKYIPDFVKAIKPKVDCIKASRYIPGGGMQGVPLKRRLISQTGNLIARNLFRIGIRDCTNGFRMVRTILLRQIPYKENNYSIILEELYFLKKMKSMVLEIPYVLTSRIDSKSHYRYTLVIFWCYFKYALKALFL